MLQNYLGFLNCVLGDFYYIADYRYRTSTVFFFLKHREGQLIEEEYTTDSANTILLNSTACAS